MTYTRIIRAAAKGSKSLSPTKSRASFHTSNVLRRDYSGNFSAYIFDSPASDERKILHLNDLYKTIQNRKKRQEALVQGADSNRLYRIEKALEEIINCDTMDKLVAKLKMMHDADPYMQVVAAELNNNPDIKYRNALQYMKALLKGCYLDTYNHKEITQACELAGKKISPEFEKELLRRYNMYIEYRDYIKNELGAGVADLDPALQFLCKPESNMKQKHDNTDTQLPKPTNRRCFW